MKSSNFQLFVIGFFVLAFIVAVIVFSGLLSNNTSNNNPQELSGTVLIWGTLPDAQMQQYVTDFNSGANDYTISYEQHAVETFNDELVLALANGTPPDLIIFPSEIYAQISNRLYTIPFAAYNERGYRDTNIDGAQLFLSATGVQALPLVVDPLVVYYNKNILAARNFITPPTTWDGLSQVTPLFVRRDNQNVITQSSIGLGTADNVTHARDILSALFLQTGSTIIGTDTSQVGRRSTLTEGSSALGGQLPTAQALSFYTGFADPTNVAYTWNRSMMNDLDAFLAGKSAFYIGRASELFVIQSQNPNLNFDVQELFQSPNSPRPITYGSFIGVGVIQNAPNFNAAYDAASQMSTSAQVDVLSKRLSLPPVRRDLLLVAQSNPYITVFFRAASSAFSWPDPNYAATERIFRGMITSVLSGATSPDTAIYDASRDLQSNIR
jgi:ABC-type glycerol-3-phosphate transport system substrate-binding protein